MTAETLELEIDSNGNERSLSVVHSLLAGLDLFAGKWKLSILWYVEQRPRRFGELSELLGRVSPKVLTYQLRDLEQADLIEKVARDGHGHHYRLTSAGVTAMPLVQTLRAFGDWHLQRSDRSPEARAHARSVRLGDNSGSDLSAIISGWKVAILTQLQIGSRSFGNLWSSLVGIQPKELVKELQSLEASGVVENFPHQGRLNHYRLTQNGSAIAPIVRRVFDRAMSQMWREINASEKSALRSLVRDADRAAARR